MEPAPLRILILSHNFAPEVSAGASRFHELARAWVAAGHDVTVVTVAPNHPTGILYPGYHNKIWQSEIIDGINVIRLWTYLAPNKGTFRRIVSYASYLASTTIAAPWMPKADVVVSTSPHFFGGLAGFPVSRIRRAPWVLDVRDLWPDSILAVGAMKQGLITRSLKALERFAYRRAAHVVSASDAFIEHFKECGVDENNISVVTNGVDLRLFSQATDADADSFRKLHSLDDRFVAAYIGTHGMAHKLETILQAAELLRERADIFFLLVGDGAEREQLVAQCRAMALSNVLMLPQMPRQSIPIVWAATDAAIVTLRDTPLFELVIPSKMFEAMAMRKPIILGVRGHAKLIVEHGECGMAVAPGDPEALADAVVRLCDAPEERRRMGENGYHLATSRYDRNVLANRYCRILHQVASH